MVNYDVMVGGVYNGSGYAKDYLTKMQSMPMPPDAEQNYNLTSSWEMDGYTSLMFSRKRDTGDTQGDVVIEVRSIEIQSKIYGASCYFTIIICIPLKLRKAASCCSDGSFHRPDIDRA
ncbi:uncharacterized protein LOC111320472 [Stylophora pistillata]|uniref:uncharacterized protein LOC111320472 n=1 Tax=Stylophora pistillata TaxID=50429 RepID=UPI000C04C548|nr:uncharacterized protein LOC111320472 [Stylophora pistillata]